MSQHRTRQAEPPRLPPESPRFAEAVAEHRAAFAQRSKAERAWIVRGFLLLGTIVLLVSIAHAGLSRAFVPGWWREW